MINKKQRIGVAFLSGLSALLLCLVVSVPRASALSDITSSLSLGSTGADVTTLQTFLAQDPSIYPQGLVTGYFGALTQAAVTNFQNKYGIQPVGQVGPITRAEINMLINNGGFGTGAASTGGMTSTVGQDPAISNVMTALASPYTSGSAGATVNVTWQTDRNTTGEVFYSTSPLSVTENSSDASQPVVSGTNVMTMSDNTFTTSKSIALSNLWPNNASTTSSVTIPTSTNYYYLVEAVDQNGNVSITWPRTFNSTGVSQSYQ
jgi:hypothetical protein